MFVDVSGFTSLGEELRASHGPVQGGQMLAERITHVISQLATLCLDFGGDVSKFAGDALLCVWEGGPEEEMLREASQCALAMLAMMREEAAATANGSRLEIHGGLARGSLLHFHLGSADDQLRWYLMAGEALAGATALVDVAQPGEMLCMGVEALTATTRTFTQTLVQSPPTSPRAGEPPHFLTSPTMSRTSPNDAAADADWPRTSVLGGEWPRSSALGQASSRATPPTAASVGTPSAASSQLNDDDDDDFKNRAHRSQSRAATVSRNSTRLHLKYSNIDSLVKSAPEGFLPRQVLDRDTLRSVRGASSRSGTSAVVRGGSVRPPLPKDASMRPVASPLMPAVPAAPPPIIIMTADSPRGPGLSRGRTMTEEDPVLRSGLPRSCNVYIPKALRHGLDHVASEMRHDVGVLFVDVESLALSDDEMASQALADAKLDELNAAFVRMTRAVHCFGGEVRDMLFDDKGCVFIATFGAHPLSSQDQKKRKSMRGAAENRSSPVRAVLSALAIGTLVEGARIGVSCGACFVGMCGVEKRHDFIVIGHEVNMAARLMVEAEPNQIVISSAVRAHCEGHGMQFTERHVHLRKKDKIFTDLAYVPNQAFAKREAFIAEYRYSLMDQDLFVGREDELESVDAALTQMCLMETSSKSGVILIHGPDGSGKTALAQRIRKMGKGRIAVCAGGKPGLNAASTDFHAFSSALQSLMGLRVGMRKAEVLAALDAFKSKKGEAVDVDALAWVIPYLVTALSLKHLQDDLGPDPYAPSARPRITQVAKAITWVLAIGNADARASGVKGVLLLIEHVEALDARSLLVLDQIVDHLDGIHHVALCITASTAPASDPRKAALVELLLAKVKRGSQNLVLELEGLTREESRQLVSRGLGHPADDKVVELLHKTSKGMPLHLASALQWVKERGFLKRDAAGAYTWVDGVPPPFPNNGVIGLVQARFLEELSATTRALVILAAASKVEEFDCLFLVAISSAPAPTATQVLSALFEAMEAGVVLHVENKTKPEVEHLWHFKHVLIEKALRDLAQKQKLPETNLLSEKKSLILRATLSYHGKPEDFDKV